jgi:LytR cell envelope-related transcriptional attenuator
MSHPLSLPRIDLPVRQWRAAAIVLTGVAVAELVLLVVVGGAFLSRASNDTVALTKHRTTIVGKAKPAKSTPATAQALPRRKVGVLVLNGNGRTGAASIAASQVTQHGYRVRGVANAPTTEYSHSIVMYRPGFKSEGARLARDLGVTIVGPLDGMGPSQLHGAHTVLILGGTSA